MTPRLIRDLREALQDSAGKPVEIEDPQTHQVYILMTRDQFQRLVYDDSDLTEDEMQAAAGTTLGLTLKADNDFQSSAPQDPGMDVP